ncbi:hypothetical protein AGMMS50249_5160 [candidate division SR1 bacterium]|nr:hypothetical protein AGMMS50249_5160 [candidate division SR1 bacterium]
MENIQDRNAVESSEKQQETIDAKMVEQLEKATSEQKAELANNLENNSEINLLYQQVKAV